MAVFLCLVYICSLVVSQESSLSKFQVWLGWSKGEGDLSMLVWKAVFRSRGRAALSSSLAPSRGQLPGPLA